VFWGLQGCCTCDCMRSFRGAEVGERSPGLQPMCRTGGLGGVLLPHCVPGLDPTASLFEHGSCMYLRAFPYFAPCLPPLLPLNSC